MKTPKVGQLVYVGHLSVRDITKPSVKISEREFYRTATPSYAKFYRTATPSYAKGELRWVVGPPGKGPFEGSDAPFGIAYKPESVFETREAAQADLNARIEKIIASLRALQS